MLLDMTHVKELRRQNCGVGATPLEVRRMKRVSSIRVLLTASAALGALMLSAPAVDPYGLTVVDRAQTPQRFEFGFSAQLGWSYSPLRLTLTDNNMIGAPDAQFRVVELLLRWFFCPFFLVVAALGHRLTSPVRRSGRARRGHAPCTRA